VGIKHTIPAFERAKTVHALDRAATVIGYCHALLGSSVELNGYRSEKMANKRCRKNEHVFSASVTIVKFIKQNVANASE
jgi:hypothetical protein